MADNPCKSCQNYDPIIRGKTAGRHGRCAAKSTYPAQEQKGQVFPPGVKREAPGVLAKPVIVLGSGIVPACTLFRAKPKAVKPANPTRAS
jgi:hypothetical protein